MTDKQQATFEERQAKRLRKQVDDLLAARDEDGKIEFNVGAYALHEICCIAFALEDNVRKLRKLP